MFFNIASKWPKWCAQTLHPFSQILKFFSGINASIVAASSFSNLFHPVEIKSFSSHKKTANLI